MNIIETAKSLEDTLTMNYTFLKSLLPMGIIAFGALTAGTANAALITYSTSGLFGCNGIVGCSVNAAGNIATISGFTITYLAQPATSVNTPPPVSSANFGEINVVVCCWDCNNTLQ